MKIIDFKTSEYVPGAVFFGVVLLPIAFLLIFVNVLLGLTAIAVSLLATTTHYRVAVDFDKKMFRDYIWILGIRNGNWERFETIEYIFIKTNNVTQTLVMNRVIQSTINKQVYDAYLRFSERQKIHLISADRKKTLLQK